MNTCVICGKNKNIRPKYLAVQNSDSLTHPVGAFSGFSEVAVCRSCQTERHCVSCGDVIAAQHAIIVLLGSKDRDGKPKIIHQRCAIRDRENTTPSNSMYVGGYSWKPRTQFHNVLRGKPICSDRAGVARYMGIELEVDSDITPSQDAVNAARKISLLSDKLYIKHDGSLSRCGFEIVSVPATLDAHDAIPWDEVFDILVDHDLTSNHPRCGLHIHINKPAVELGCKSNCIKLWALVNQNADRVASLAGRTVDQASQYASYRKFNKTSELIAGLSQGKHKYAAVNTSPQHTIELRMMRTEPHATSLAVKLQMADSMVAFIHTTSIACIIKSGWESYRKFVNESKKRYAILAERL